MSSHADKYVFEFTDFYDGDWRARIQVDGFSGTITRYDGKRIKSISLNWQGRKDIYTPIIPSICDLTVIAHESFDFRDLITTDPLAVRLRLEYFQGGSWVEKWTGYQVPDIFQEKFIDPPYEVQLKYIDGLGLLKNIEYNPIGPDRQSVREILGQIFEQLDTNRFFDVKEYVNIHETSTNFSSTDTVFNQHYIDEEVFRKGDRVSQDNTNDETSVNAEYENCYNVLSSICEVFAARCWYDVLDFSGSGPINNPTVNIMAINYIGIDPEDVVAKSIFYTSNDSVNLRKDIARSRDTSKLLLLNNDTDLDFYQPTSESIVSHDVSNKENLVVHGDFEYSDTVPAGAGNRGIKQWTASDASLVPDFSLELGGLAIRDVGDSAYYESPESNFSNISSFNFLLNAKIDFPTTTSGEYGKIPSKFWVRFWVQISDGTTNYKLTWNQTNGWHFSDDDGVNEFGIQALKSENFTVKVDKTIQSPISSGTLKVRVYGLNDFSIVRDSGQQVTRSADPVFEFIKVIPETSDNLTSKSANGTIANNSNAQPLELEAKITDGTPAVNPGAFSLNDTAPYTPTENWNRESGFWEYDNDLNHLKILARERLRQYNDHKRRLKGTMLNNKVATFSSIFIAQEGVNLIGFINYKYVWNLVRCEVSFEAFECLFNGFELTYTDDIDEFSSIDTDRKATLADQQFALDITGDRKTNIVTENNTVIPSGQSVVVVSICEMTGPRMELPDIDEAEGQVTVKVKCDGCTEKELELATNANDTSTIAGQSSIAPQCGESVTLLPTNNNEWIFI